MAPPISVFALSVCLCVCLPQQTALSGRFRHQFPPLLSFTLFLSSNFFSILVSCFIVFSLEVMAAMLVNNTLM